MRQTTFISGLFLVISAATTRADVLYNLTLTATDGTNINGTGSFSLSQLPPLPSDPSSYIYRIYRPFYDQNPPDPYGDVLETMDFKIDGYHFFLDPTYPPFAFVAIQELFDPTNPGGNPGLVYPADIFFQTNAPDPNPFAYVFDVSANPNGYYQYTLDQNVGTDHDTSTSGVITITSVETTPEPSTLVLVATGAASTLTVLRRRFA